MKLYDNCANVQAKLQQEFCNNYFYHGFRFTPQEFNLDLYLKPFIPNYIAASGDVDVMIKVNINDKTNSAIALPSLIVFSIMMFRLTT